MPTSPIDEYVRTRLPVDQQEIVAVLRALLKKHAPHAQEVISRLDGIGTKTRHLKLKKLSDVDHDALGDYWRKATSSQDQLDPPVRNPGGRRATHRRREVGHLA